MKKIHILNIFSYEKLAYFTSQYIKKKGGGGEGGGGEEERKR